MKTLQAIVVGFAFGVVAGAIGASVALGVFANPQSDGALVLAEAVALEQDGARVFLPPGISLQLTGWIDDQPYYALHFVAEPGVPPQTTTVDKWEYFYATHQ